MAAVYEPPVSDDRGELVIRPSWRALVHWDATAFGLGLLILVAGSLRIYQYGLGWLLAFLGIGAVILVGGVLYLVAYMTGTRITVTADAILVTHWFWSTARVDPKTIARVVRCSVRQTLLRSQPQHPVVFAFSAIGRCVLSLYADRWSQVDLDRIWRHLGITPEDSWDDVINDQDLDARFPGAF
jgi:hypothetical protein